jgi:serine protease AprX
MTTSEKTWASVRDSYLRQVTEALKAAKYPSIKGIIEEVRQHLESRYAELPADKRNWDGYQAIVTEMGPPSDYAELLGLAKLKRRLVTWRRIAIWLPIALVVLIVGNFFGVIPLTFYHGPRVFFQPEAPAEPAFVEDARLIGKWQTVGLVHTPSQFVPGGRWVEQRGWLKALTFMRDGTMEAAMSGTDYPRWEWASRYKWTKDWIIDSEDRIQAQYVIKEIGDQQYLFYPWISGDIMYRWMNPPFYVMKMVAAGEQPGTTHGDKAVKYDSSGNISGFDINTATLDDVIKVFGEPQRYMWKDEEFARDRLPQQYVAVYPNNFGIFMSGGRVVELRHSGNDGYVFGGKVKVGSTLEEVFAVVGEPSETLVGEPMGGFKDGILYKEWNGKKGYCHYGRRSHHVRFFFQDYKVCAIYVTRDDFGKSEPSRVAPADGTVQFDPNAPRFNIDTATLDDVIKAFGQPQKYVWDKKEFAAEKLPATYVAVYPDGFSVCMSGGKVMELRHEGPDGFALAGKVGFGSTLDDAVALLGKPRETVVGKANGWADGVVYMDIDGKKGDCYYAVSSKCVRMFFIDYRVAAIYTTRSDFDEGSKTTEAAPKPMGVTEFADVRGKDLSGIDLASQPGIVATLEFDEKTVWPKAMPAGQTPQQLMNAAKNPGLGVRELHKHGITGKGVSIAIIDQPLYQDHPEFAGKIARYFDVGCKSSSSMHGPAVASLLVGTDCGTAPDATLYYVAAPSWLGDSAYYAKALDILIEQNAKLPAGQKIRAVSVSAAPSGRGSPFKKNGEMWDQARRRAEDAGMLILDCTADNGFIAPGYYDLSAPDDISKCIAGFPGNTGRAGDRVAAPCSRRTTAQEFTKGSFTYAYWGQGGLSWSIPYATGVLAMAWQIAPDLSAAQMKELLFASAYTGADGGIFIDPANLMKMAGQKKK